MNVFLTGASSGIGAALAAHYGGAGARLGLFARRADALEAMAQALLPESTATYVGDVRDAGTLRHAAEDFISRFGAPDIVIASAGISVGTLTEHVEDMETFRAVLDTNVLGMVHTFQPFLAAMRAASRGTLAGVASVAGFRGLPGAGAYCASKAAAINYLESLRVELYGSGVRVVTICPGYIATPMTEGNPYPMPFLLSAEKAARLISHAIDRQHRFCVLPWQMALLGRLFAVLPRPLYDRFFAARPHKPRNPGG